MHRARLFVDFFQKKMLEPAFFRHDRVPRDALLFRFDDVSVKVRNAHRIFRQNRDFLFAEVKNVAQGLHLLEAADRPNAGLLIDPIHFDRGGNVPSDIAVIPRARLRYMQLCDAPAERPRDHETLIFQARSERLMPGDGGLDLKAIVRAMPVDIPIALEVPMRTLAQTVGAVERAKRMREKTEALLARL